MVGFRKKSQDSSSPSWSSAARADGRAGAASSGAAQRTRAGRNEPIARTGKGRRGPAAGRRGYKTSEQMDSRCLTLAESASSVLGRSAQILGQEGLDDRRQLILQTVRDIMRPDEPLARSILDNTFTEELWSQQAHAADQLSCEVPR